VKKGPWYAGVLMAALPAVGLCADEWCSGTLGGIYITSTGDVVINGSWRGSWTQICHLHQAWNGVAPETCAYWYSLMAASKTHNKNVTIYYPNITATCATLPTYGAAPGPGYVMQN
jgi:hypothetical protein